MQRPPQSQPSPLVIQEKRPVVVLSSAFEFRTQLTTMLRSHYRVMPVQRQTLAAVAARDHRAGAIVVDLNCRSITFPMQFGDVESGRAPCRCWGLSPGRRATS